MRSAFLMSQNFKSASEAELCSLYSFSFLSGSSWALASSCKLQRHNRLSTCGSTRLLTFSASSGGGTLRYMLDTEAVSFDYLDRLPKSQRHQLEQLRTRSRLREHGEDDQRWRLGHPDQRRPSLEPLRSQGSLPRSDPPRYSQDPGRLQAHPQPVSAGEGAEAGPSSSTSTLRRSSTTRKCGRPVSPRGPCQFGVHTMSIDLGSYSLPL